MAQKLPFDGLPPPAIHASVVHGTSPLLLLFIFSYYSL